MMENRVELNLGLVCNNHCKFCLNDKPAGKRRFVSPKVIEGELAVFRNRGYDTVAFLGGEPTIYPDLAGIIRSASSIGYKGIHLISNGRKYSDKDFLRKIIGAGATRFYVSIHSHKPEIEDFLTSVKGSFAEKLRGISNLVFFQHKGLIRDNILLNTVINNYNYRYLAQIISFYKEKFGLANFRFNFIRPAGRALKNFRLLVPKYTDTREYMLRAINLSRALKANITFEAVPFCLLAGVRGGAEFIGELKDGIREARFGDFKREEFFIEQRRKDDLKIKRRSCRRCTFDICCEGPWKNYVKVHSFQEFKPIITNNHFT